MAAVMIKNDEIIYNTVKYKIPVTPKKVMSNKIVEWLTEEFSIDMPEEFQKYQLKDFQQFLNEMASTNSFF